MADKITGYTFDRMRVTPQQDSLLYDSLGGRNFNYVLGGYKNHMHVTGQNLAVTVDTGAALICGRMVEILEPMTLQVPANYKGYLVITIDLTKTNTSTGTPGEASYTPVNNQVYLQIVDSIIAQDLKNGGQIYQYPLAAIVSNGSTMKLANANMNKVNIKFFDDSPWKAYYDGEDAVNVWKIGEMITYQGYFTLKSTLAGGGSADAFAIPEGFQPGWNSIDFPGYNSGKLWNMYANTGAKKMTIGQPYSVRDKAWITTPGGWYTLNNIIYFSHDYRGEPTIVY